MTAKNPQKQGRMLEGGGIFLAGQNIYPCRSIQPFFDLILMFCYSYKVDKMRFQQANNKCPNHPESLEVVFY